MKFRLTYLVLLFLLTDSYYSKGQGPLLFRDTTQKGPQTFALISGVSKYQYIRPLAYADKDAELFRDWLRSPGGGSMADDHIFLLVNDQVNNSNFWGKGFQWLKAKQLQKGDRLFIYLAGHGDAIDEDQFFYLGYDCNPMGDKNNYLVSGAIQLFNLKKKIANETAKGVEVFFIMDACRSNELPGGTAGQNFLNTAISQKQAGEIMMLATGAGQPSLEDAAYGNGHGLFTWYLVDGLSGMADVQPPDQRISFNEIRTYVDQHVTAQARQRFKRKQEPYFCCNENSNKLIGTVDTAYFRQWIKQKQRTGNAVADWDIKIPGIVADTVLLETYNRFYTQVRNNNLTGNNSAEDYYLQLEKKYPLNPYTLDAKSTLAVQFLNVAQKRIDDYLGCMDQSSPAEKEANYRAAVNLEKAIASFREDDEDFARSLHGRLCLLKASADDIAVAFSHAYACLAMEPKGAYVHNKLAQLHLQQNNRDSAMYYAQQAAAIAPDWGCALTVLSRARNMQSSSRPDSLRKNKKGKVKNMGMMIGAGMIRSDPSFNPNSNPEILDAKATSSFGMDLGMLYYKNIGKNVAVRPTLYMNFSETNIEFIRRGSAGGPSFAEKVKIEEASIVLLTPLLLRLSGKNISPYIMAGPSFHFSIRPYGTQALELPVKSFSFMGNAGAGVDIGFKKGGYILSPEIKYAHGFSDLKENGNSIYSNALSSLKRNFFTLSIYLRAKN